jgi:peptide deformylase
MIYINPYIIEKSEATEMNGEGCLSFPNMTGKQGNVIRHNWIKVETLNSKDRKIKNKFTGIEAIIFQHEYDHLDSIVYIDRQQPDSKQMLQSDIDELIQQYPDDDAMI